MMKKLLDIFLKYKSVSGTMKYLEKEYTILCISRENVIPMISVEVSNLNGSYTERGLASSPKANSFIAARLVNVNEMI
jgi:hypothetical protein